MSEGQQNRLIPRHVGIIMDGNGRWAQARGLPRAAGHQAGVQAVRRAVDACCQLGIEVLAVYAFSTENWQRPASEVATLMRLIEEFATRELPDLQRNGVRVLLMGRREGLPTSLLRALDAAIDQTRANDRLILNLALNYGGRPEIVDAARAILTAHRRGELDASTLDEETFARYLYCPEVPDADLIIRTAGDKRLSNFMLWRAAGALFWSTPVWWPDFQREHLEEALRAYRQRSTEPLAARGDDDPPS